MNNKTRAALIGGAVVGVLSAIPAVNTCCCLWAIAGGALAVYLYVKDSPTPVRPGDGAVLGLMVGGIGTAIYIVLGIPLALLLRSSMMSLMSGFMGSMPPDQQDAMRQAMQQSQSAGSLIFNALLIAFLLILFSTLGGLVGVPLFEKRGPVAPPPPPPPPDFNQTPGGGFGGPTGGSDPGAPTTGGSFGSGV